MRDQTNQHKVLNINDNKTDQKTQSNHFLMFPSSTNSLLLR